MNNVFNVLQALTIGELHDIKSIYAKNLAKQDKCAGFTDATFLDYYKKYSIMTLEEFSREIDIVTLGEIILQIGS